MLSTRFADKFPLFQLTGQSSRASMCNGARLKHREHKAHEANMENHSMTGTK